MGTSAGPNVERQSSSGILIESEDDDPGIRGCNRSSLSSSSSSSSKPSSLYNNKRQIASQFKTPPASDLLDAAIIDQTGFTAGSAALKLDQYILGKTEVAPDIARGSLSTSSSGSALSSLKGVAAAAQESSAEAYRGRLRNANNAALDIPPSAIPPRDSESPKLTWSSSSPVSSFSLNSAGSSNSNSSNSSASSSSSSSSDNTLSVAGTTTGSRTAVVLPKYLRDDVYHLPIKRMIKQVCVAGLEHNKGSRKFCLTVDEIRDVCKLACSTFMEEPMFLRLDGPIKVVGDIHGQFGDLMRLFKMGGMPPSQHYLFLGDYVDRGKQSMETIMLLLLLKLRYPNHIHLLRGNHECAGVTKVYGFYDECKRRSSIKSWRTIVDVFNTLPVAALIGERIFCVHGGISPSLNSFSQINAIQRPTDVPEHGILADLLWSDPDGQVKEWSENDRGVSFCFGQRSLERFCKHHDIDLVVRGHMVVEDGYEFFAGKRLVTVFSAPNYCGDFDNSGAMMSISESLVCSFDTIEPKAKAAASATKSKSQTVSMTPSPVKTRPSSHRERDREMSKRSPLTHRSSDVLLA